MSINKTLNEHQAPGLYQSRFEKDNCGFGLIAHMDDKPSHWLMETAITALCRLTHRGAISGDGKTGDGCGLLFKKPDDFFRTEAKKLKIKLAVCYAAGIVFLHPDSEKAESAKKILSKELSRQGLKTAGWRTVPINPELCGDIALQSLPVIEQVFVNAPKNMDEDEFNRKLFTARRIVEKIIEPVDDVFYLPSLSSKLISYKALVIPENLALFYTDLQNPELTSSICVFHQRFSTNTWPQWRLSQPFRYLAHNGEINTIQGNRYWTLARGYKLKSDLLPELHKILPLVSMQGSDSCSLDNMLETLLAGGMDVFRAMRLMIPPAWQNQPNIDPNLKAFYEYNSAHMQPWDGPAGIVLTDGRYAACCLDRNGLRPARYVITNDRHITLASETGVYDYKPEDVVQKGRLGPGQMIVSDTKTGELLLSEDIDWLIMRRSPYSKWLKKHSKTIKSQLDDDALVSQPMATAQLQIFEKLFQVTFEERDQVLRVLAEAGQEAIGSMGDDTPMAVLSKIQRSPYDYFRQQFAQVTNPPIDPLRESIVMSLETCLGAEANLFAEREEFAKRITINSPVLSENKFKQILNLDDPHYAHEIIELNYPLNTDLESAIQEVCERAVNAAKNGKTLIVLSDKNISQDSLPIHALFATGAVHYRLVYEGLRCDTNIIVETATARDPHHFAVLISYGASAIFPYLAYESLHQMIACGEILQTGRRQLAKNYRRGIKKGLYKIISKMGISTIDSYRGAQLFEIIGINEDVVNLCFPGSISRIGGSSFADFEKDQQYLHQLAWNQRHNLNQGGLLKYIHGGEYHAYNPDVVKSLQTAVNSGSYEDYKEYASLVDRRDPMTLRDLLKLDNQCLAVPIDEVESEQALYKRFDSAGMSLGALSPEAHEALAIAMNRLGGRSNSGEGGEALERYGTEKSSKIKQIASGRFGVTPHYLINAEVLQIKIAQGAKPGEGGQLPGHKVNEMIAKLRYSNPGVALISPPPHHDIYSIEDLAQLIFDLKQINPKAQVSVKLVSEAGIGTIAAGVAKAYADLITISGYDGGTGASPLTSVHYTGSPWEMGLAETHQTLVANKLRHKVRIQTDGGLKTGLDVVKAAILGAESFAFGTAPMVAMGCKYLRICHLNNCATGVATQNRVLRFMHFHGNPEKIINYFKFIARDVREIMAGLGIRKLNDLIGRVDLLKLDSGITGKQQKLDLNPILNAAGTSNENPKFCTTSSNPPYDQNPLAKQMLADIINTIDSKSGGEFSYTVCNQNRSIGAQLSGEIARRYGDLGMEDKPVIVKLTGSAGQSLGVWNAGGLHIYLSGDANDYVGKGMAGGKIVLTPPPNATYKSDETSIIGNTCLYGATGGKLYAAGLAGERFAVRNSGAHAVVEGLGDHGCEYMTGGVVTVLGPVGANFAAGMTGGLAFVYDQNHRCIDHFNHELIDLQRINTEAMEAYQTFLHNMIQEHYLETQSRWSRLLLDNYFDVINKFWMIKPKAAELDSLLSTLSQAA